MYAFWFSKASTIRCVASVSAASGGYGIISKENYCKGISEYTAIQSDVNL